MYILYRKLYYEKRYRGFKLETHLSKRQCAYAIMYETMDHSTNFKPYQSVNMVDIFYSQTYNI